MPDHFLPCLNTSLDHIIFRNTSASTEFRLGLKEMRNKNTANFENTRGKEVL
jgi:hypothetical protein